MAALHIESGWENQFADIFEVKMSGLVKPGCRTPILLAAGASRPHTVGGTVYRCVKSCKPNPSCVIAEVDDVKGGETRIHMTVEMHKK